MTPQKAITGVLIVLLVLCIIGGAIHGYRLIVDSYQRTVANA